MEQSTPGDGDKQPSLSAEVEMGDSVEVIIDGNRIEAFMSDNVVVMDPSSIHTRMGIRAYAYSLSAEDRQAAVEILRRIGREG